MILTHSVKVCLATRPCDLRKSFDTLSGIDLKHGMQRAWYKLSDK